MSAVVLPLVHSRPKFAGWVLSPTDLVTVGPIGSVDRELDWDFAADGPPTSSTMPHPTPQYAQSVFTVVTMASTVPGAVCAAITHRLAGYDVVLTGRRTMR